MEKIQCIKCGKEIEGYSQKQVLYMLNQHILAKHSIEDLKSRAKPSETSEGTA